MLRIAQGAIEEESLLRSSYISTRGFLCPCMTASAFSVGIIALWSGQSSLLSVFLTAAYLSIFYACVRSVNVWRDPFNPLCLVVAIGFIRFLCPGILLLSGAEPSEEASLFFQLMQLSDSDWMWGHALALTGLLAVVLGWMLTQERWIKGKQLKFHLLRGVKYASVSGMLVGFVALLAFVLGNASLDVVGSGDFRETTVQVGTGKYFFMAYLLIAGSVLLCCYLLTKGHILAALFPVVIATLLYWVLGGRTRAMISLAGGLLLLWYFNRQQNGWAKLLFRRQILVAPVVLLCILWISYVGSLYRGELGARAFIEGFSPMGLWQYVKGSVFTDLGQLHSLAGAIAIGPGVLGGQTFIGSLTWPLNKLLPMPGRSGGVFIIETLVGFMNDERWGVNASLIGDSYLNFGLWGVIVVMITYGALLKFLYLRFRQGDLHSAIYVLALVHGLQMFWVSIEVWPQTLTVLAFGLFMMLLGRTVFQVRGTAGLR